MLVFFFPFFENLGSYVCDSMRARTVLFLKGISVQLFVEKLYGMRARALAVRACGAACDGLAALGVLGGSAAKWTNVVWPIKSRQTNKHTLLFYRYRLADHAEPCSATVPRQYWAAEKQT